MNFQIVEKIREELKAIEAKEGVTILFTCESGSRAWGFESRDSDYDVRFVYVRPTDWYLTIQPKRDVIEKPIDDELDISGWDIPKALELFRKSNPPLLEWLQSPVVYRERPSFAAQMKSLLPEYYSPISCMYHYLHMARGNFREYLHRDTVRTKKYLYVLRPILACLWIEAGHGAVPMEFQKLVDRMVVDPVLKNEIDMLVEAKRQGQELDSGPKNRIIGDFLQKELERLDASMQSTAETKEPSRLDRLFVEILREVNGTVF